MTGVGRDAGIERISELGSAVLRSLHALELVFRHLDPAFLPGLRERIRPALDELRGALGRFSAEPPSGGLERLAADLGRGAERARLALEAVLHAGPQAEAALRILGAMRDLALAQEWLYPLRTVLPPVSRFFAEPARHADLAALEGERAGPDESPGRSEARPGDAWSVGIHRAGAGTDRARRGGFCLYVPESSDGSRPLPLVVALHGGFGHGADFLWTWLREARSRCFLLLAPTSRATTWSLSAPDVDGSELRRMVAFVSERWSVDDRHVLLTGLSDGATFSLLTGLHPESPFTALAPVSGVLHPMNFALGNLERARGRRIRLVHGARDWMFPVDIARLAKQELERAGADLVYREIEDLSHAYPREENGAIVSWLAPSLALADGPGLAEDA